jgi:fructose-bisphosphate aldolase/2-amino-3,7-dideoxy-D-threo-hept-6-ulosonate synthase
VERFSSHGKRVRKAGVITTSLGKQLRLRRVSRKGRYLVLPFDHPIYFGPQPGAEDPARLVALARDHGATAVLLTSGALRRGAAEIGDLGVIMRIDATLSHMGGPDTVMHLLHNAEEAAVLGADMVVVNVYVGLGDAAVESALLQKLAAVSRECERIGMPLCGEIIPRGPAGDTGAGAAEPSSESLALAMRFGLEYGCDIVKTVYNGDPEGFRSAVQRCHLPVIMAGGPKAKDDFAIFMQLGEAMASGASGAAIGRRVWGSDRPAASLEAVRAIVMDDAPVAEALKIYRRS